MATELEKIGIFQLCNCPICITFVGTNSSRVYRLGKTNFYYRSLLGDVTWWVECPRRFSASKITLEDMLEMLDEENQTKIIFNLNLFTKSNSFFDKKI